MSSDKLSTAKRPLVITILAILAIISGLLCLVGALASPILIIGAIIEFIIAYGFIKGWKVMWIVGLIVNGINLILSIWAVVTGNWASIVALIIYAIIILYLFKPNVRAFFKI